MLALAAVVASLAAYALANPVPRQTGAACTGLSSGSTDTPAYNFTLTALNTTLPNANTTGAPLVLGWGTAGSSPAASDWAISVCADCVTEERYIDSINFQTYAAWGSNEWPYFMLNSGNLLPQPGPSEQSLGAYDRAIEAGGEVGFIVTIASEGRQDPQIYCAEVSSSRRRTLTRR